MRKVLALAVTGVLIAGIGLTTSDPRSEAAAAGGPEDAPVTTMNVPVGTTTNHLVWSTTAAGDLALRLVLDFDFTESCAFVVKSAGRAGDAPIHSYLGHDKVGRTWTSLQFPHPLSAHASDLAVVFGSAPTGLWAAQHTHLVGMTGEEPWIFAGFDLQGWNNPFTNGKSLMLDLSCSGPFTITEIHGGTELLGFTPTWMRGGVGATAPLVTANVADTASRSFSEPTVHLRYRTEDQAAGGTLRANTPAGSVFYPLFGDDEIFVTGPDAGTWGATLVRGSVGPQQGVGVVVGVRPVASLDAAAAL